MKTSLKKATKEHFEQQTLSQAQLSLFENILKEGSDNDLSKATNTPDKKETRVRFSFHQWLSIAAMLILTISSLLFLNPPQSQHGLIIAKEVIANHIRQRPLEVNSDNFEVVGAYFTQLNFNLTQSNLMANNSGITILGGRYCSIQSEIAAQIRYQDKAGNAHTLYQVKYDPDLFDDVLNMQEKQQPAVYDVDGFKVSIWVEKGLLMANVSPY